MIEILWFWLMAWILATYVVLGCISWLWPGIVWEFGYEFGIGSGAFGAAIYHQLSFAFFQTLLFLVVGSVLLTLLLGLAIYMKRAPTFNV